MTKPDCAIVGCQRPGAIKIDSYYYGASAPTGSRKRPPRCLNATIAAAWDAPRALTKMNEKNDDQEDSAHI